MARTNDRPDQGGGAPADEGWGSPVPGTRPIAGASPAGTSPGSPPPGKQPGRGRTWLILLVSFGVQLVVVLVAGNTAVVRNAGTFAQQHNSLLGAFATLPSVYAWRLTPPAQDPAHAYPASLFGLLTLFLVAVVLTVALIRGPVTFWRAFVAVWLSVLAGTLAAGMVRRGVLQTDGTSSATGGKAVGVLFQGGGTEVVAGLVTGLLAALVAAIVAVVSRRPAEAVVPLAAPEPAPFVEPAAPPPWHGDDVRPAAAAAASSPPSLRTTPTADDAQATTQFAAVPSPPAVDDTSGATTQFRREDVGQYGPPTVVRRDQPRADESPADKTAVKDPAKDSAKEPVKEPAERQPDPSEVVPVEAPESAEPPVDQRTTQFPVHRPQQSPKAAPGTERTQAMPTFPRPPDDEDLGHQPDD